MENFKNFLRHTLIPLGFAAVFLLSTAGKCKNNDTPPLPSFQSVYTQTQDISISSVSLMYDVTYFMNDCLNRTGSFPMNTMSQLMNSHNVNCFAPGTLTFSNLLSGFYQGISYPYVQFVFTDPECSGSWTNGYTFDDGYLCLQNTIKYAPKLKTTTFMSFNAQTVTTTDGVSIKWQTVLNPIISGSSATVDVYDFGYTDYPLFGYVASRPVGDEVAIRVKDHRATIVENTVPSGFPKGNFKARPVQRQALFSDVLMQDVCMGGQVSSDYKWSAPQIVELVKQ